MLVLEILLVIVLLLLPIELYALIAVAIAMIFSMVMLVEGVNHIATKGILACYIAWYHSFPLGCILGTAIYSFIAAFLVWLYFLPMPKVSSGSNGTP